MCTREIVNRIANVIFITPFNYIRKHISCCLKCPHKKDTLGKLPALFRRKNETASTMELFEGEDGIDDKEGDEDVSKDVTIDAELEYTKQKPTRLKKTGKAVRKAVGKGLIAYSDAALMTPNGVGYPTVRYGKIPGQEISWDCDYHAASYGVYL